MPLNLAHFGREFLQDPRLNFFHRVYIRIFGIPISGLRIRLRRILPRIRGEFREIADLGCGKGIFTFELARLFPRAKVVGIDNDSALVFSNQEVARRANAENVHFENGDICAMSYESIFDLAVSVDNLEHIDDDVSALKSIHRSLKPGGVLICHVPALERIWVFWRMRQNFDVKGHVRPGYRREELREKLVRAGFAVIWLEPTYGYLETVSNNLSYLITRAEQRNVLAYAFAFPILNAIAWLGRAQKVGDRGAGLLAWAVKPAATENPKCMP